MRTHLAIALGLTILVCGCYKADYEKALAANRRLNLELKETKADLRIVRAEKEQMERTLQSGEGTLQGKEKKIRILEEARAQLQERCDKLAARCEALLRGAKPPDIGPISITPLPQQVDKALQDFAKANPDLLEYLAAYGMVKLKADFTFERGSDLVQKSAQQALAKFVDILESPNARGFNVFIAGHTDDIPIVKEETKRRHPNNWYLSVHRAVAVQQVLQGAGLAPERICALGFGEYHPVEPNAPGKRGNKANRRVEIWIVPPDRFLTTPAPKAASK
ncbi:MAG: OmpA family protein [Planctomycetota bacterium]|jgi:chemotaxis protein MotB